MQRRNPHKASQRHSDATISPWPVTTKGQLAVTLSEDEGVPVNMEVKHLILGLTYLRNARQHLVAVKRFVKNMNPEYADRMKEVIGLLEGVEKRWPLEVR